MKKHLVALVALAFATASLRAQDAPPPVLEILAKTLSSVRDEQAQLNILRGMTGALKGKRQVQAPAGWSVLYEKLSQSSSPEVRRETQALAAIFGGGGALGELRKALGDTNADSNVRRSALDSLVSARDAESLPLIVKLLNEPGPLRVPGLSALAGYNSADIPQAILTVYPSLTTEERRAALSTLIARSEWAQRLTVAIDANQVPRADLTAALARQLQALGDPKINQWLEAKWGAVRASSESHQERIRHAKTFLTPASFENADPSRGRAYFAQLCMTCHAIFGSGGNVGPELTGAYMDVDYLLQNILDPNAIIGKDYQQTIIQTKSGQFLAGINSGEDETSVTLKTLAGPASVQRSDIAELTVSPVSMMPEGLLGALADDEIRDLFAYLQQHGQIPMLVTAAAVNDFYNGVDLKTWHASSATWKVEDGAIVGRGTGSTPEFLVSDMVAQDFRLTAQVRVSGDNTVAEIAFRGVERDGLFEGASLSFGGAGPAEVVKYRRDAAPDRQVAPLRISSGEWTQIQISARGSGVEIEAGGGTLQLEKLPGVPRSVIGFYVLGPGAELQVKDVKLELLPH